MVAHSSGNNISYFWLINCFCSSFADGGVCIHVVLERSMRKVKNKILLLFISFIFSLFLLEILLRIYMPFQIRVLGTHIDLPVNSEFKISFEPTHKLDQVVHIKRNSLGFRGEEPPADFDFKSTFVVVGGSTTESIAISEGKTWIDHLDKYLKNTFNDTWINNAGIDGHSSFGHLALLKGHVAQIRPKYALFLIGANDLNLLEARKNDFLEQINSNNNSFILEIFKKTKIWLLIDFLHRNYYSSQMNLSSREIVDFNQLTFLEEDKNKNIISGQESYPDYEGLSELFKISNQLENQEYINLFESLELYLSAYGSRLNELIDVCIAAGIQPIFITQPSLYGRSIDPTTGVDLGKMLIFSSNGEWGEGLTGAQKWYLLDKYNDVTRQVGRDRNVLVIDLARKMPKDSLYYYDFIHFSNQGSEKVAEIVFEDLCEYLLQSSKWRELKASCDANN